MCIKNKANITALTLVHITDCHVFCSSPSLCVPLFIVPTKRLRLPCVFLFISQCAFVYHVNQQRRLRLPSVSFFFRLSCVLLFISECAFVYQADKETWTAMCFVLLHLSVCCCLLYQQRDSDCPIFCCSSLYVPLFIVPAKRLRLPCVLLFMSECAFGYCANKETQTALCFVLLRLCVPLFIMPTKRLKPPTVLFFISAKRLKLPTVLFFISVCAFIYCANKEIQTAVCFVLLHLCVPTVYHANSETQTAP